MKNLSHLLLLCAGVLAQIPAAFSQQEKPDYGKVKFYPPSAASMMKYIDYPVSYNTGIPDISIPLHTIRSGSLELPLTLSFHIDDYTRVNQIPGVAGAGWSLSTDLQISRSINGIDDFANSGYYNSNNNIERPTNPDNWEAYYMSLYKGERDGEPDKFYYKLINKSGAFYFDSNKNIVLQPQNDVKITFANGGFTILDSDGTQYLFPSTYEDFDTNQPSITLAWKCTKITAANQKDIIEFSYAHSSYGTTTTDSRLEIYDQYSEDMEAKELNGQGITNNNEQKIFPDACSFALLPGLKMKNYAGPNMSYLFFHPQDGLQTYKSKQNGGLNNKLIQYNYVTEIRSNSEKIVFQHINAESSGSSSNIIHLMKLNAIQIQNKENSLHNTITLTQEYTDYARKLKTLQIDNQEKYEFTYGFNHQGVVMPDFWGTGYYADFIWGDAQCGQGEIPITELSAAWSREYIDGSPNPNYGDTNKTMSIGWANKNSIFSSNFNSLTAKILTITYPTGGKVEFTVGDHRFMAPDGTVKMAGGCRIEEIRYWDIGNNLLKRREFKYGPAENGCGTLRSPVVFDPDYGTCNSEQTIQYLKNVDIDDPANPTIMYIGSARKRTLYANPTTIQNFESGSAVVYDQVAVYDREADAGKTVYFYNNSFLPTAPSLLNPHPLEPDLWYCGTLDSIAYYRNTGGEYEWIAAEKHHYDRMNAYTLPRARVWATQYPEHVYSGPIMERPNDFDLWWPWFQFFYDNKPLELGFMRQNGIDSYNRGDNGVVMKKSTRYEYADSKRTVPTKETTSTSTGETITTYTLYPADYSYIPWLSLYQNILSVPVERVTLRQDKVASGELLEYDSTGAIVKTYQISDSDLSASAFRLSNKSSAGNYDIITKGSLSKDPSYTNRIQISYYTQNHKIKEVSEAGQPERCYLWGYNGEYPIAEIVNANYSTVSGLLGASVIESLFTSPSPSASALSAIEGLRSRLPDAEITTATYIPLTGIKVLTDPQGHKTTYDYYGGTQKLKKVFDHKENPLSEYIYRFSTQQ